MNEAYKPKNIEELVNKLRTWAERAKCAQVALDLSKDPEDVAIRAGQLQDLSEEILRVAATLSESAVALCRLGIHRRRMADEPWCFYCGRKLERYF